MDIYICTSVTVMVIVKLLFVRNVLQIFWADTRSVESSCDSWQIADKMKPGVRVRENQWTWMNLR